MTQLALPFGRTPRQRKRIVGIAPPRTYDLELDGPRLERLLDRVRALMSDGAWRTLAEIVEHVGGSEAGVSARLRDLRKAPIRAEVERRRRGDPRLGLWEYRVRETP